MPFRLESLIESIPCFPEVKSVRISAEEPAGKEPAPLLPARHLPVRQSKADPAHGQDPLFFAHHDGPGLHPFLSDRHALLVSALIPSSEFSLLKDVTFSSLQTVLFS